MSVAVGEKLPCQREGANSEDLSQLRRVDRRSRKISTVCLMILRFQEIVGGVVRRHDLVMQIKIMKFFSGRVCW